MANDLNQCQFIGRLGRDPETKYLPNGDAVTNFSIAVGSSWTDKQSGEKKEDVEWVRCVTFKKLAEICGEYLKKGSQVFVSGKMKTRKWQDKEGNDRYTTEIRVDQMQMLGTKAQDEARGENNQRDRSDAEKDSQRAAPAAEKKPARAPAGKFDDTEDEIPF